MIKRNVIPVLFSLISFFCFSSVLSASASFPADSIRVKWMEGKKYILHKVETKETWQHLSKRYNCTIADLKSANGGVESLKVGQIINVPVATKDVIVPVTDTKVNENKPQPIPVKAESASSISNKNSSPVTYTVMKGETMYSIAKRFNKNVQEIKEINKLSSDVLSEGQVLIVGFESPAKNKAEEKFGTVPPPATKSQPKTEIALSPAPPTIQPAKEKPQVVKEQAVVVASTAKAVSPTSVSPASGYEKPTKSVSPVKKGSGGKSLMQVTETGVATWIQDGQINNDKYYALHRSAPIGTIVKVTNRMNNQFVYVKVVGVLPDTGENDNVIIKVSQAVSSKLTALDRLFQAELSYGLMQ